MPVSRRSKSVSSSLPQGCVAYDRAFLEKYRWLHDWLVMVVDDDGNPRTTSTLTLFAEDGMLKASLSDRDADEVLFAAADSLEGVLESLDSMLGDGTGEWRKRSGGRAGRRGAK